MVTYSYGRDNNSLLGIDPCTWAMGQSVSGEEEEGNSSQKTKGTFPKEIAKLD